MLLPKKAIDQSLKTYLEDSARARAKLIDALNSEWKILNDCYSDNAKTFKDAVDKARAEQKRADDRAYQRYQKRMGTQQGGSFSDFEADKAANKRVADQKIEEALGHRKEADEAAENIYKKRFDEIFSQHKEDVKTALDKLEAEHPGKGETAAE
jgi:hypothetical protein